MCPRHLSVSPTGCILCIHPSYYFSFFFLPAYCFPSHSSTLLLFKTFFLHILFFSFSSPLYIYSHFLFSTHSCLTFLLSLVFLSSSPLFTDHLSSHFFPSLDFSLFCHFWVSFVLLCTILHTFQKRLSNPHLA